MIIMPFIRYGYPVGGMGLNDVDDTQMGIDKFLSRNPETRFGKSKALLAEMI